MIGDVTFLILHILNNSSLIDRNPLYDLTTDRGYAEIYQYIKYFWIATILAKISFQTSTIAYIFLSAIFMYFLVDDSLILHERLGKLLAKKFDFSSHFGLRPQDMGELLVSAIAATILFAPLLFLYRTAGTFFKAACHNYIILIAVLCLFGVVIDMAHIAVEFNEETDDFIDILEDGGEMLTITIMVHYTLILVKTVSSPNENTPSIFGFR